MSSTSHRERIRQLWHDWFEVPANLLAAAEADLTVELREVARVAKLFGFQNELLPAGSQINGVVAVIAENQSLWCIGYPPTSSSTPDGVVFDSRTGDRYLTIEAGFDELTFRALAIEAVFANPNRFAAEVSAADVETHLGAHLVLPALTDFENYDLPAIWSLPGLLVMGFGHESLELWVATKNRATFDSSQLPRLADWFDWTDPST